MKVLVIGGSGFVGSALTRELSGAGHDIVVSTRKKTTSGNRLSWNPPELIAPDVISTFDAVINLAGENIFSERWTSAKKERIRSSRVDTTKALVESMSASTKRPDVLINASAIGYYGPHGDEDVNEETPPGGDFLAGLCEEWEAAALQAKELGIRVVIPRFGIILGEGGGALSKMLGPFKAFVGGYIGSGKQWMSWVHIDDITGFIRYAFENKSVSGPFNVTAPGPVRNREFGSALGKVLGRPAFFPVPALALKLALGEFGDVLLTGQRVVSGKAVKAGYMFKYTDVNDALKAILHKK
jgi:uncharacterized protein (TIGR01777 family)